MGQIFSWIQWFIPFMVFMGFWGFCAANHKSEVKQNERYFIFVTVFTFMIGLTGTVVHLMAIT